jgi:hypothetical protein
MMMNNRKATIAALTTAALVFAGADRAASETTPTPKAAPPQTETQQKQTPLEMAAGKDFGKLSVDGAKAFVDLTLARRAIFDGRVEDAKKDIQAAVAGFDKAKTDQTVFAKAESDLKPPAGKSSTTSKTVGAAPAATTSTDANKPIDQTKTQIAWIPIDGAIAFSEDFAASPAKKAAVADANKHLKGGDRKGAMEQLKLADMIVDVTLGVVPLDRTIVDVHQAAELINDGKYYEASQLIRRIQDSERFDSSTIASSPAGK